jgi:hypothetical protein
MPPKPFLYGPDKRDALIDHLIDRLLFDDLPEGLSEEDRFALVLDRAEQHGLGMYGIEAEAEDGYLHVEVCEHYGGLSYTDPRWYKAAFAKMRGTHPGLSYGASFIVPEHLIEAEAIRERTERGKPLPGQR